MWIFIRQGSASQNLTALIPTVLATGPTTWRCAPTTGSPTPARERAPERLCAMAVAAGVSEIDALVLATANPADYHGFRQLGALAPGYQADVLCFDELSGFRPARVYRAGRLVAEGGRVLEGTVPATRSRLDAPFDPPRCPAGPRPTTWQPRPAPGPARSVSSRDPSPRPRSSVTRVIRHRAWPASQSSSGTATPAGSARLGAARHRARRLRLDRRARRGTCHGGRFRAMPTALGRRGRSRRPTAAPRRWAGGGRRVRSGAARAGPAHRRPDERAAGS